MTSTLGAAPAARIFEVEELVALVLAGEIRIPEFQRPFRWGIEDARRLFDSIFRGYPLGSLLLWEREAIAARIRVGALEIDAPSRDRALWVVDGQQRVTTLANALTTDGARDERFRLSFNLQTQQFVTGSSADRPLAVALPVLFDLQRLLQWFKDNPGALDYFDAATGVAKRIRQAKIPASVVDTQDEQVLREIFDRLNSYGKRLTRAEVFSALHPQTDRASSSIGPIEEIASMIERDLDFGAIDGDTVLKAVLARRGPDITRETRGEFDGDRHGHGEFPGEDADTAYAEAHKALERAVRFLQDSAEVPHFAFLPYRHLLIVLTRFFAHHQTPSERQRQLLRRWFWRAAGAGPELFPGSTTGTARALCSLVDPGSADGTLAALLGAVPQRRVDLDLEVAHFRSNYATGKVIACAMWACAPRSLRTGDVIDRPTLAESLAEAQTPRPALTRIASRRVLDPAVRESAASWLLVPGLEAAPAEVMGILRTRPIDIDESVWDLTLASHCVDDRVLVPLSTGDVGAFVRSRQDVLQKQVERFMLRRWEWAFEDTPPIDGLVMDDLESDVDDE